MSPRSAGRVGAVALAVLALAWLSASPAHAAAYRYWTYWQGGSSGWTFASAGPGATVPADGSVEGWRFAVTTQSGSASDAPAAAPDFSSVCASTPAESGRKRVALVVDTGSPASAPPGQTPPASFTACVVAEPDATGYQVLRAATTVRTDSGLVCGIAGYPVGECAPVVDAPSPAATPSASTSSAAGASSGAASSDVDVASAASSAMPAASAETTGSGTAWATIVVVLLAGATAVFFGWRRRG